MPLLAGSWGITLDPTARNMLTAWSGDVCGCHELGKVTESVTDHVGPVDRSNITVRDELEMLARNQSAEMRVDTIKPLANPATVRNRG